jgi:hypothetical protein
MGDDPRFSAFLYGMSSNRDTFFQFLVQHHGEQSNPAYSLAHLS